MLHAVVYPQNKTFIGLKGSELLTLNSFSCLKMQLRGTR